MSSDCGSSGPGDPPAGAAPEALDARLAVPALTVWLGAFLGTGPVADARTSPGGLLGWSAVVAVGVAAAAAAARARALTGPARSVAVVAVLGLGCSAAVGALHAGAVRGSGLAALAADGAAVQASGVLTADPAVRRSVSPGNRRGSRLVVAPLLLTHVVARGRSVRTRAPVLLLARDPSWSGLLPGQPVSLSGRLGPARPGQAVAAVVVVRGPPALTGRPPWFQRAAGALRAGLREACSVLPGPERGLLPGLVLGDTSRMPPGLDAEFRTAGLTHLTAVSGANLAILVGFVLLAGRWAGLRGRWLPAAGSLAMVGFVVLARPQPSVLRAAVMGGIGLLAVATGRRRRSLAALTAAVVGLLLADPWLARSFGFVLSALATAGLVLLAPGWARAWSARGLPRPVAEALAVPLAAQLVCAPVIVLLSGQVSVVAVAANLLAAPAVAPATVLGVLVTALAPASPGLAALLARLAAVPTWWLVQVAHRSAAVPGAAVDWPGSLPGAALLAGLTAGSVLAVRSARRRPAAAAGVAAVLTVALVVPASSPGWPPHGWVMAACDVGQGDALVLAVAAGTAVLVDAGPDPAAVDRCLRRLGVRRVPLVLLTHLHADHVEGLPGVLRGRQVGELVLGPYGEPAEELLRVRRWAARAAVPVTGAAVGQRVRVGPVSWRVLWPARVIGEESVPNNASVVVLVRSGGLRLLLLGDVEPPAQRALLTRVRLPAVDVLKVAHHGSRYQVPQLLAEARPRLALVSVGAGNDYGHPAPATLAALRRIGALVGRTDRDGTLVVVGPVGRLRLVRSGR